MSTCRQRIVDAIVSRLKTLTVANGYSSDAGLNVYSWFPENLAVDRVPILLVNDVSDTISDSGQGQTQHNLRLTLEGQLGGGTTMAVELRSLLGDLVAVLMGPSDRTLGGECDTMDLQDGGTIQLEQRAEDTVGAVSLSLGVTYRTQRGNWSVKI
jgi:hypothetical protein